MALSTLKFDGSLTISPVTGQLVPGTTLSNTMASISQAATKFHYQIVTGDGSSDAVLSMGGVSNAKFLFIQKQTGSNLRLEITHADGTDEVVPVGKLLILECSEKPVTGIKYTFTGDFEVAIAEW